MKKIFTLMVMSVLAIAAQAKITIYVQCDTAPFIWSWGAADGQDYNVGSWPGTNQLTQKYTHPDTGEEFWTWTFEDGVYPISFLFNNGDAANTKQTADINGVKTDRYFILSWDDGAGNVTCEDVTEDYSDIKIPDAEVNRVTLVGNHNNWGNDGAEPNEFTVVEAGKVFQLTVNTEEYSIAENLWEFKFRPNHQDWVGYWDVFYDEVPEEGKAAKSEAPEWLSEKGGNFLIDLEEGTTERVFTFTATWGGGKEAGKNWLFKAEAGSTGITTLKVNLNENAPMYNLQGQRVAQGFRGIAIQNGRKVIVK